MSLDLYGIVLIQTLGARSVSKRRQHYFLKRAQDDFNPWAATIPLMAGQVLAIELRVDAAFQSFQAAASMYGGDYASRFNRTLSMLPHSLAAVQFKHCLSSEDGSYLKGFRHTLQQELPLQENLCAKILAEVPVLMVSGEISFLEDVLSGPLDDLRRACDISTRGPLPLGDVGRLADTPQIDLF